MQINFITHLIKININVDNNIGTDFAFTLIVCQDL